MEFYNVLTEDGEYTGLISDRDHIHSTGLWHETVHVWIRFGEKLLLQKRSFFKDTNPGLWDISSAGHIESGEEIIQAALREINEELGLSYREIDLQLLFKVKHVYKNDWINDLEWSHVFFVDDPWEPPVFPSLEEIENICFLTPDELKLKLDLEPHLFVDHKEEMKRLFKFLKN